MQLPFIGQICWSKRYSTAKKSPEQKALFWGSEIEDTLTPKNEKYSTVGEKVSAATTVCLDLDNKYRFELPELNFVVEKLENVPVERK